MPVTKRRRWIAGLTLLLALLFAAFLWLRPLLNIGAGYAAKHACSCHFLQGRDLDEIQRHDLNFSVLGYASLRVDSSGVSSSFLGLVPRRAVFRPGLGCTLINDEERKVTAVLGVGAGAEEGGRGRASGAGDLPLATDGRYEEALDYGMQPVPGGGARGIVVLHGGRVVAERYAPGYDGNSRLLGWSMTKTLTGMALGARSLGTRAPEEIASQNQLYPEWAGDARAEIELRHLLRMHSGLGWDEAYSAISDATIMLHEQPDMSAYAAGMPPLAAPAEKWAYSSGTTNILVDLLERRLPDSTDIYSFLGDLYGRIAPSLIIEPDQSGSPVGSSYGWATARDWARLGQFMLQDGVWNGDTLLQPGWVGLLRQPAAGSGGVYGGQLWLPDAEEKFLPADTYLMRGFQDQRVFILPAQNMVIARLGHNEDKVADFGGLVRRILEATPI